jgi:uncharacterized membrane protein YkoI
MLNTSKLFTSTAVAFALSLSAAVPAMANIAIDQTQAVQAGVVTKAQAEAIALQAVGNGKIIAALLEKEDNGLIHWSIDIRGTRYDFEVWVSTSGKVLRIITQPL